jgi:hypothetical protein
MEIQNILAELREERRQVSEVILILERLAQGIQRRKTLPTAMSLQALEGGKPKRTVSPETRAKLAKAQRKRWAGKKKTSGD